MKKRFATLLLAGLLILSTACSGGAPAPASSAAPADSAAPAESTAASEAAPSGEVVELKYACWAPVQLEAYDPLFREFEAANPNIKVVTESPSWAEYWTKVEASIQGGSAPDIFWLNIPKAIDYMEGGALLPLDGINVDTANFPPQHVAVYQMDGKTYGIPKDFDSQALFYNKEMFDKAGISYPDDSWTWDSLTDAAKKLTGNGVYGIAAPLTWQDGYYETIFQAGGYTFSPDGKKSGFDDPKTIAGVQYYANFVLEGMSPPMEEMANLTGMEMFNSEKVAMYIDGSWDAIEVLINSPNKDKYDVAMLPKGEKRACTSNALAHVVYSKTKHPEEAKKLIEFLSTKEAMEKIAASGVVIPSFIGTQDAWVAAFPGKNAKAFTDILPDVVPLPNVKNAMACVNIEGDILSRAWTKEITVEEACKQIAEQANAILNQ